MIEIDLRGAELFINSSRKARGQLTRTVWRSLKRSLRKPVSARRKMTQTQPMVRAILRTPWGKKPRNRTTARVKRSGPKIDGNTVNAGVLMYGYAAAARGEGDYGGRIVPHTIVRGDTVLRHPGAQVTPQIGMGDRTLREAPEILRQLERDVHEMLDRVYGL